LIVAMILYGTADSFRDGTHKAIIYAWLRQQGREDERTKIYGYTRSWSKLGSALSALIAAALVLASGSYSIIFLCSAVPAALNLVNLATYPRTLDETIQRDGHGLMRTWRHLRDSFREVAGKAAMRRLVADSVTVEGSYAAVKDYLQIVAQACAISLPLTFAVTDLRRTAVISGITYAALHFISSRASRQAHRFETRCGGTEPAVARIYQYTAAGMLLLGLTLACGSGWLALLILIALGVTQNLWRPIHIGRFDRDGDERRAATLLSIESQASSLATAIWAPAIGWLIDHLATTAGPPTLEQLWPIALPGLPIMIGAFVMHRKPALSRSPRR
ncbi:MAG: hypothetical protein K9M97_02995, partial [Akkermansiaceae bacterium]|nr:hypothetical protein [Akkermansiaceae bacterium]